MRTGRLLLTVTAATTFVLASSPDAIGLRPAEGSPRAWSPPATQAPGVATTPVRDRAFSADGHGIDAVASFGTVSGDVRSLRGRWLWPLAPRPRVVRPFAAPSSAWGAGHRGVDLSAGVGQPVLAVAAGRVSHVGVIAGKPTVSVLHPDGLRSTYEPVTARVAAGALVAAGSPLGDVAASGSHCAGACIHLGAIRDTTYLDPLVLLGRWRVRLLPLHGTVAAR